jgi:hypothetical protein
MSMAKYCITAANHKNPKNHVASSFELWQENRNGWERLGGRSAKVIVELLESGDTVTTAEYDAKEETLTFGAAVEVELRISKNGGDFPITGMPTF